jgi:hypothetical protein
MTAPAPMTPRADAIKVAIIRRNTLNVVDMVYPYLLFGLISCRMEFYLGGE